MRLDLLARGQRWRVDDAAWWVGLDSHPLPLAISPVIYFLAASVLFKSWHMALATLILGIGHLPISYWDSRQGIEAP